jgi:hypothetical protein
MKTLIITILVAVCLNVRAAETVTLVATGSALGKNYSSTIALGPGVQAVPAKLPRHG